MPLNDNGKDSIKVLCVIVVERERPTWPKEREAMKRWVDRGRVTKGRVTKGLAILLWLIVLVLAVGSL
jgi:hypothetical protein